MDTHDLKVGLKVIKCDVKVYFCNDGVVRCYWIEWGWGGVVGRLVDIARR
jgi:hypothetical protein